MPKWTSPAQRVAQERNREVARIADQVRGEVNATFTSLIATWGDELPRDWETLLYRAGLAIVKPQIHAESTHKFLAPSVMDSLMAPRRQEMQQRERREQIACEKAAAAAVDMKRPVVATVRGAHKVGEPVILREVIPAQNDHAERLLVCIGCRYVAPDYEANEDGGDYSELAEPSDTERALETFQRVQAQIDERSAYEQRQGQRIRRIQARRQRELDAIRADGREPTLFEDMFAGTSDD